MADEADDGQDTGAEAAASGVDSAAVALALNAANIDPSIAEDARAFLRKQSALIDDQRRLVQLQARELSHELGLCHWSLWVLHASGVFPGFREFRQRQIGAVLLHLRLSPQFQGIGAPNWGRLHLKWGEALGYGGKKDEAQKQYALAARARPFQ